MSTITNVYGIEVYQPYLPYGRLKIKTPRIQWAIDLAEAKAHLRIDSSFTGDDTYITALIKIAQDIVEKEVGRMLSNVGYTYVADGFLPVIDLGLNGNEVLSVSYKDVSGSTVIMVNDVDYVVSNLNYPYATIRIYPKDGTNWPVTENAPDVVEVNFTAGQVLNQIPDGLMQAMFLIIGRYYEMRQDVITGTIVYEVPLGAQHLINQYKQATV